MKGTYKSRKGQFSSTKQPIIRDKKIGKGVKVKHVKRTYLRLTKDLHKKTKSVPRSVRICTANDGGAENNNNHVFLRPNKNDSNIDPSCVESANKDR